MTGPLLTLIIAQGIALSILMAAAWWYQKYRGNAGWVDVCWTFATGAAGIAGALWPLSGETVYGPRQIAVAVLAALWSARLGLHLRTRVLTRPEDVRYAGFRRDWGDRFQPRLFAFLQIQALAAWPLGVAILTAARNPKSGFESNDGLALAVIVVALAGEAIADRQLARFVHEPANQGRVCDAGLWSWSRHPNYFFEFLGWCAWPVFAFNTSWPIGALSLLAPAMMYWLLVYVSGIPPLEKAMLASRGDAYRDYQKRTNAFLPLPPRQHEVRA